MMDSSRLAPATPLHRWTVTLAALLLALLAGASASAQEVELKPPQARQGYWLATSVSGAMNLNSSTEDGDIGPVNGAAFQGRVGEMVTDWLGFGLQFGGGFGAGDGWETGFGGLMMDVQLVGPWVPHLSLHLNFGAGGLQLTEDAATDEDELKGTGGAYYAVGLAYDWFPFYESGSGGFALTPHVQLHYMPGNITESYLVMLGVEFTWWTGLDRDKLDLPFEEQYRREE